MTLCPPAPLAAVAVAVYLLPAVSPSFSAFYAAASHHFTCYARILDAPLERLFWSRLTAHYIPPSYGTESSTRKVCILTRTFPPGGSKYMYSATLSAVIRSSVT